MTMYEIPLFPLNTVLFPGTPLQLHIFEERYKRLVSYCRKVNSPFGVVLIQKGVESYGPVAEPYSIGCTAQIAHIQPLDQGRMNIIALGLERFRILTTRSNLPYLVGIVESMPLDTHNTQVLSQAAEEIRPWFNGYITRIAQGEGEEFKIPELISDPLSFAYITAMLLQIPAEEKQELLEINEPLILLQTIQRTYQREIALTKALLQNVNISLGEGISFSKN